MSPAPRREGPGASDGDSRLLQLLGTIRADVVRLSERRGLSGRPAPTRRETRERLGLTISIRYDRTVRWSFFRSFSTMILPQVHLRKPCYDFSFL